jgi:3',5'-cyclic AMP phosphodiesterase CpdA
VAGTLVHISDLHVGQDAKTDARAARVAQAVVESDADVVLVTGDVTHRGSRQELARFEKMFRPLRSRLVAVPGNHDRMGDDVAGLLMSGPRVQVEERPGLWIVRVDSTAEHNRSMIDSHGELTPRDVEDVAGAVDAAPPDALVVVMLHHHVLPLPEDHLGERISSFLGWPYAEELPLGLDLVALIQARCHLVLHGHRHREAQVTVPGADGKMLHVLNAGSSPRLARIRMLTHERGRLLHSRWLDVDVRPRPAAVAAAIQALGSNPLQPEF